MPVKGDLAQRSWPPLTPVSADEDEGDAAICEGKDDGPLSHDASRGGFSGKNEFPNLDDDSTGGGGGMNGNDASRDRCSVISDGTPSVAGGPATPFGGSALPATPYCGPVPPTPFGSAPVPLTPAPMPSTPYGAGGPPTPYGGGVPPTPFGAAPVPLTPAPFTPAPAPCMPSHSALAAIDQMIMSDMLVDDSDQEDADVEEEVERDADEDKNEHGNENEELPNMGLEFFDDDALLPVLD